MFNFRQNTKTILHGIAIGVANIIPGVSGGTLAVIFNIYDQLIASINLLFSKSTVIDIAQLKFNYNLKRAIIFLILITCGALIGIVGFSKLLDFLFASFNQSTMMFFIGLILGSIPVIYRSHNNMRFSYNHLIAFLSGGTLLTFTLLFPKSTIIFQEDILSVGLILYLFISGFIAAGSMVIPGISGSLILLIIGSYSLILKAVSQQNLVVIGIVGFGALFGIILFTKVINFFLKNYPSQTYYFIMGLMISSVPKLWPGMALSLSSIFSIGTFLLGIYFALHFSKK